MEAAHGSGRQTAMIYNVGDTRISNQKQERNGKRSWRLHELETKLGG